MLGNDDTKKSFIANKLRELREELEIKQSELASLLHISQQAYSAYESGRSLIDIISLQKIAEYFDVPITVFLYEKTNESKTESVTSDEIILLNNYRQLSKEKRQALLVLLKTTYYK